jgi:hypothetical protein
MISNGSVAVRFIATVFLLFIANIFSVAQEFEKDYTSLLTSKIWKIGDEKKVLILYKFNTDGTFFRTMHLMMFKEILDEMGKWEWTQHDAFTMQTTHKIVNGELVDLNPQPYHKAVYRIRQIDRQMVKGISYNILESEDSEYVNQFKWVVKE